MKISDLSYHLPPELIAQDPVTPRDHARLLVYNRSTGELQHRHVYDLPDLLPAGCNIVANNSRVRHSRLFAQYGNREKLVEILVLEHLQASTYRCLLRGHRLMEQGTLTVVNPHSPAAPLCTATITLREEIPGMHTFHITFDKSESEVEKICEQFGEVPLPPYITESHSTPDQYQTVFAEPLGSAAAPTAGLHFTPELISTLQSKGHPWKEVTLHVGMGTFLPLRHEELTENTLHEEQTYMSPETVTFLNNERTTKRDILAVGTTSTRTLESHTHPDGLRAGWQGTNLFI